VGCVVKVENDYRRIEFIITAGHSSKIITTSPTKSKWMGWAASLLRWHDELVHDVSFAPGRVLAHVEVEARAGLGARWIESGKP
jgi:hypothetical protein